MPKKIPHHLAFLTEYFLRDQSAPRNQHTARARRRKMQRFLDKNFPIKDDER